MSAIEDKICGRPAQVKEEQHALTTAFRWAILGATPMDAELRSLLMQNNLLKDLDEKQARKLEGVLQVEEFPQGSCIIRQAAPPDRVFLIARGQVQVRRRLADAEERGIADLGPGTFVGEMAVIRGAEAHSATVVALTPVTAFSLAGAHFTRFIEESPAMLRNVLSSLIHDLQGLNDRWLENLRVEKQVLEWKVREHTRELEEVGQRVRRELALAQNIQRNLLPEKRRSYPGISITADYIPCEELGGDIIGVFQIDETRLGVYGGDVCGHGVYAAMVMSYVKKLIETSVKRILLNRQYVVKPPGAVLTAINQSFIDEISQGDPEIYLTLFLGVLDMRRLTFEHASAGIHVPPLVLSQGKVAALFDQSDFPIGHVKGNEYTTHRHTFGQGDVFLFVSDGVPEARHEGEIYGMEHLKAEALRSMGETGRLEVESIVGSVRTFLGGEPPQDDMCLLSIAFEAPGEPAR
jgi:serine phosphatase RsbU (regulator of sigma subunit)